mgnify:CR=1 FL=1
MKISKDLADAVMMVACIVLVLIGTTTFESASTKAILMTVMAVWQYLWALSDFGEGKNRHTNPLDKVQLLLFRRDAGIICRLFFCLFLNLL